METLALILALGVPCLLVCLLLYLLISGWRRHRSNRFRMISTGLTTRATVTGIDPGRGASARVIRFAFTPKEAGREVSGSQRTTQAAVAALHLQVGAGLEVYFNAAHPHGAFSAALVRAERAGEPVDGRGAADDDDLHFFVSYSDPALRTESDRANTMRWYGPGELRISRRSIRFRPRQLFRWKDVERVFPLESVLDVEQLGAAVSLHLLDGDRPSKRVRLWAVSPTEAARIAQALPATRTSRFVPAMADTAAFVAALRRTTPRTPVTSILVGLNAAIFGIATLRGGGFLVPDPAAMIDLGTDYTPLTLGGQWWRLFTAMFLHFGVLHLALNLWVLWGNGAVTERIFGSARYLVVYLVAGLSGSLVSLLWHPLVNGAGASGAIFGLFGALMAFFVRRKQDLPASVFKSQLSSAAAFVCYNLLLGARGSVDNAAHLGGLGGGFIMGLLLARPLGVERTARDWTAQWVRAGMIVTAAAVLLATLLATGRLTPRQGNSADARRVPTRGIAIAAQSLQGVALGMSPEQLLAAKGQPIRRPSAQEWLYDSIDARHDGVLSAQFGKPGTTRAGAVDVVEYFGDRESAPGDVPFLKGLTAADVVEKYGQPASTVAVDGGTTFLWFRNGIRVGVRNGRVVRYGIFDHRMVGNP